MTEIHQRSKWSLRLMWIVWPAFLLAGVQEMLVFALVDPEDLSWRGAPVPLGRMGIYSLSFLAFWLLMMAATALAVLLSLSSFEVNHGAAASDPRTDEDTGPSSVV